MHKQFTGVEKPMSNQVSVPLNVALPFAEMTDSMSIKYCHGFFTLYNTGSRNNVYRHMQHKTADRPNYSKYTFSVPISYG